MRSFLRIRIWSCIVLTSRSIFESVCSSRIFCILLATATTSSIVLCPSFWTSAARGRSNACRSAASSSQGCSRLANFSASPASSIMSLEPFLKFLRAAQASSLTEPMPRRESGASLAASQEASSSRLERMLEPVAPMRSWHQVILLASSPTSPSWNRWSSSANQSDKTCWRWSYLGIAFTIEFILVN